MTLTSLFVHPLALGEDVGVRSLMALDRGDEANPAVAVLVVVTGYERLPPGTGLLQASKAPGGIGRVVLAGPEQCLGIGVIIAGARAAIGGADPQPLQGLQQGLPFPGTAVVGRQDQVATSCLTSTSLSLQTG